MTKPSDRRHRKRDHNPHGASSAGQDRAVYIGLILIGAFTVILGWIITGGYWREVTLAYLAGIAYLIILSTFKVYRGRHIPKWQQSLARIPLRFVGYGTKSGKPLEAAHDHANSRHALIACVVICLALLAGLCLLLLPDVLG